MLRLPPLPPPPLVPSQQLEVWTQRRFSRTLHMRLLWHQSLPPQSRAVENVLLWPLQLQPLQPPPLPPLQPPQQQSQAASPAVGL